MKRMIKTMTACLLVMIQTNTVQASDDIKQIQQVIQWYFDGTSQGKPALIEKAFLPSLELQYVTHEGKFKRWLGTNYIRGFNVGKKNSRVGKILAIDVTGDSAMAKATITDKDKVYTDYFLLLKLDHKWKIANKIFTRQQVTSQKYPNL